MEKSPLEIVKLWEYSKADREDLLKRSESKVEEIIPQVEKIVSEVKKKGDSSLLKFTKDFDNVDIPKDRIQISEEELDRAYEKVGKENIKVIERAAEAVKRYHLHQLPQGWEEEFERGVRAGQVVRPLESVGVYVPGGTAKYPSTVLMSVIPAKVAGVKEVVLCTPPNSGGEVNPEILVASKISGVDKVYRVGGAQAIAAMAYGTESIPKLDKIVGPGNVYVTAAKKLVSMDVEIDFLAGPSEVLILADSSANPRFVALDLVAQAEHDESSSSILVTTSEKLAKDVKKEITKVLEKIPRGDIASKALRDNGLAIIVESLESALDFTNKYAPEHLEIMVEESEKVIKEVNNAGAIFVGSFSPTCAGDFGVGPSHILPTGGKARVFDGLNVFDFLKMPSIQKLTRKGLESMSDVLERFSEMEGLHAHGLSVKERLEVN